MVLDYCHRFDSLESRQSKSSIARELAYRRSWPFLLAHGRCVEQFKERGNCWQSREIGRCVRMEKKLFVYLVGPNDWNKRRQIAIYSDISCRRFTLFQRNKFSPINEAWNSINIIQYSLDHHSADHLSNHALLRIVLCSCLLVCLLGPKQLPTGRYLHLLWRCSSDVAVWWIFFFFLPFWELSKWLHANSRGYLELWSFWQYHWDSASSKRLHDFRNFASMHVPYQFRTYCLEQLQHLVCGW